MQIKITTTSSSLKANLRVFLARNLALTEANTGSDNTFRVTQVNNNSNFQFEINIADHKRDEIAKLYSFVKTKANLISIEPSDKGFQTEAEINTLKDKQVENKPEEKTSASASNTNKQYRVFLRKDNINALIPFSKENGKPIFIPNKVTPAEHMNTQGEQSKGQQSYEHSGYLSLFEYNFNEISSISINTKSIAEANTPAYDAIVQLSGDYVHVLLIPDNVEIVHLKKHYRRSEMDTEEPDPLAANVYTPKDDKARLLYTDNVDKLFIQDNEGNVKDRGLAETRYIFCHEVLFCGKDPGITQRVFDKNTFNKYFAGRKDIDAIYAKMKADEEALKKMEKENSANENPTQTVEGSSQGDSLKRKKLDGDQQDEQNNQIEPKLKKTKIVTPSSNMTAIFIKPPSPSRSSGNNTNDNKSTDDESPARLSKKTK